MRIWIQNILGQKILINLNLDLKNQIQKIPILSKNLTLTGMMGVGKSTIGKNLAKKGHTKKLKIDETKHIYEKILNFENINFNNPNYKNAYIHLLLQYVDDLYIPQSATDKFEEIASEYNEFDNLINKNYKITKNEDDKVSKDDISTFLDTNHIKWEYALNEFKRMGLKYDRTKKLNKKTGVLFGIKERDEDDEDE